VSGPISFRGVLTVLGPTSGGPNYVRTHLRVLKWEFNLISGDPSVLGSICIKIWSNTYLF